MLSSNKAKVIIDTNVFISGILFGGNPRTILKSWIKRDFIFCLSPELKAEIIQKLKFKFTASDTFLNSLSLLLDAFSEKYIPQKQITLFKDKEDNFLLDLAEESQAGYIVSGDKHVIKLKNYKSTKIISPKDFLDLLKQD